MTKLLAIARREYAAFFRVPLGWIVAALFLFVSGWVFARATIAPGQPASMREFFAAWWGLLAVICPAISMRLVSDELRSGTLEGLLTAPLNEVQVVGGKFLAAIGFLLTTLAPTLVYVVVLDRLAHPDLGPIVSGYLGVALLGALYLSVGTLVSSLTSSQTLAFLGTLFWLLGSEIAFVRLALIAPAPLDSLMGSLSPNLRVVDLARGLIDSAHLGFFLSGIAFFLGLAALSLRVRRWR